METKEFLAKLYQKLEKLSEDVAEIRSVQAAQHEVLKEHTRRSTANEEMIAAVKAELEPLKRSKAMYEGSLKVFGALSGIAVFVVTILNIIGFFKQF